MSGITPILDTLLHQVLGKRVDVPLARELPEPVRPTAPADAVQPARSDSRLNPGAPQPQPLRDTGERPPPGGAPPASDATAVERSSTRTQFSAAARTIADLLLRYPAPEAAIRPSAPLLADGDTGDTTVLARRLQASVDRSGLFYESHLRNWSLGKIEPGRLAFEPQMQLTRVPEQPQAEKAPVDGERRPADAVRLPLDDAAGEALQGVLRHQLEALATPVLRWEGEIWSGVFAALAILAPEREQPRQGAGEESASSREEERDCWQSRLTLRLPHMGEITVRLQLRGERLDMTLGAESTATATRLESAAGELRQRLRERGLNEFLLTVEARP